MMKILKLAALAFVSLGLNVLYTGCERHEFKGGTEKLYQHHGGEEGHAEGGHAQGGHAQGETKPAEGGHEKAGKLTEGDGGGKKVF